MKETALSIVEKLKAHGHEAFFAGGSVRDLLLGHEPTDIDIATSARPEEIEALFKKTYAIGKHFGVIFIVENGHHFEVATFRSDSGYSDGRRPDAVFFTSAKEDAVRRDFTINGMFYDPVTGQFFDFVGGQEDLDRKVLRFIGDPNQRIQEDSLRILRAVRFKNRFDLSFDPETREALSLHASLVIGVSAERIQDELTKMLLAPSRSSSLRDLHELGILEKILPEISILETVPQPKNYHSEGNVFRHTELVIMNIGETPSEALAWAALLHDVGKTETISYLEDRIRFLGHQNAGADTAEKILFRLKCSKKLRESIVWLVRHHHLFEQFSGMKPFHRLQYFDHPLFLNLLWLHKADILGSIPETLGSHDESLREVELLFEEYQHLSSKSLLPSNIPDLLSGEDIMQILQIPKGKKIGDIKKALRDAQMAGEVKTVGEAREWVEKRKEG